MNKQAYGPNNHVNIDREINDFYATDPKSIDDLISKIELNKNIWECACGKGHLSERLSENGFDVVSTDLIDRGYENFDGVVDFLKNDGLFIGDIVTNPPYKYSVEFVEMALDSVENGNKVCMFLKIQFLESQKRRELFNKYPPKNIFVYSKRIICAKGGDFDNISSSAVCYAWFVWEKGFTGKPTIDWI